MTLKPKEVFVSYPDLSLATTHIGSLPFTEVEEALAFSFNFDIPAWPQLPKYKEEGMLWQFVRTFPGFDLQKERILTDTSKFEEGMLKLYEDYVAIIEEGKLEILETQLDRGFSKSFFVFIDRAKQSNYSILKGQITGPFTLGISLKIETEEALIFREDLRDLLVKYLTIQALAQVYNLKKAAQTVILFFDEPGLSGFGSSAYITLSKEIVLGMLGEIISILKSHGCLTGIHVCANTSWDILFDCGVDIINFDSYAFFDKFVIYADKLIPFLAQGNKYIAWGAVPTEKETLSKVTIEELLSGFLRQLKSLAQLLSLDEEFLIKHSMLTPACGMGSLTEEMAYKVLKFIKDIKGKIL